MTRSGRDSSDAALCVCATIRRAESNRPARSAQSQLPRRIPDRGAFRRRRRTSPPSSSLLLRRVPVAFEIISPPKPEPEQQRDVSRSRDATAAVKMYSSAGADASAQIRRPVPMPSLSALKAGMPGAAAAACQTASFMWLSTTAAFQYRSGATLRQALQLLYAQGGVRRFYSGLAPTLLHVTLCRFGDTTANNIALTLAPTDSLPLNTLCASFAAAAWRATLLPLETVRANMQVRGPDGFSIVVDRFRNAGFGGLYRGSAASFSAGLVGHFPFFFTVNVVSQAVPLTEDASFLAKVGRNGGMGFLAAISADIFTNGFKVVATNKQTCDKGLSYYEVARKIVKRDGIFSIVTRGLKTRMLANGLQGATFVLLWKEIESRLVRTRFSSPPQS